MIKKYYTTKDLLNEVKEQSQERYQSIVENVEKRKIEYIGRGGQREGAGRKRIYPERKTVTKKLLPETVAVLKEFAKENKISENEALDRLVNAGYSKLKKA